MKKIGKKAKFEKGKATLDIAKALLIGAFLPLINIDFSQSEDVYWRLLLVFIGIVASIVFLHLGISLIDEAEDDL